MSLSKIDTSTMTSPLAPHFGEWLWGLNPMKHTMQCRLRLASRGACKLRMWRSDQSNKRLILLVVYPMLCPSCSQFCHHFSRWSHHFSCLHPINPIN
jgi:hypothetical protein